MDEGNKQVAELISGFLKSDQIERLAKVSYGGGLVGGTIWLLIVCAASIVSIIHFSNNNTGLAIFGIVALCTLVGFIWYQMKQFASQNPQAALFRGAEMLLWERMKMMRGDDKAGIIELAPQKRDEMVPIPTPEPGRELPPPSLNALPSPEESAP
jgi:hypothetical protein